MKRRIAAMVLSVVLMGTLGACGEPAGRTAGPALSQSSSETQTDSEKVRGTLKVSTSGESGKPVFTVETNMPDETEFVLTLQSEDYTQQQTVVVAGGSGRSEAFTSGGGPLFSGKYTLTVAMSQPSQQPEGVRAVLGDNGENLIGNFMKVESTSGAHILSGNFKFTFDGPEAPAADPAPEPEPAQPDEPREPDSEPEPEPESEAKPETKHSGTTKPSTTAPTKPSSGGSSGGGGSGGGNGNANNFDTWNVESQQDTQDSWVLNTSSLKIHYPSCSQVPKIAPKNYATSNKTESELLNDGYTTCGVCHK